MILEEPMKPSCPNVSYRLRLRGSKQWPLSLWWTILIGGTRGTTGRSLYGWWLNKKNKNMNNNLKVRRNLNILIFARQNFLRFLGWDILSQSRLGYLKSVPDLSKFKFCIPELHFGVHRSSPDDKKRSGLQAWIARSNHVNDIFFVFVQLLPSSEVTIAK